MGLYRVVEKSDITPLFSLITILPFLYLHQLGLYPLREWDEAIYAMGARSILGEHDLFPHTYMLLGTSAIGHHPFPEKSPLSVWVKAVSMAIFGVNEFAAGLPSALATIVLVVSYTS